DETPLLATLARGLADLDPLHGLIRTVLNDRGEVLDSASPTLQSIRRERNEVHGRLQQRMESLVRSPGIRGALQDAIVTLREGRYVLPVRSEARSAVPGIVHDSSASGATVYVEPMAVVDLGNRWRELEAQERHEIERILREITEAVGDAAEDLADAVDRLAQLDLALAKAQLAKELDATELAERGRDVPWLVATPAELHLVEARHPLLEGEVVPVPIEVGGAAGALLITGPNTGGKTVALKTAGLLCVMALAGLPVPADKGSRIPVYDAVFADIGDEQSIEQSLSTFSGHITAIIDILERADAGSLVLLDELGAGTDPTEGAVLAIAIVEQLVAAGVTLIATTHHSELKLYAHNHDDVANASVEFDIETLAPTYHLRIGIPGQSNALAIATRLGMPADVIEAAAAGLSSEQRDLETVLADLRNQLAAAEDRAARAAADRDAAEELRVDLQQQLSSLAEESAQLRSDARDRVREEVRDAERLLQRVRREVESARLEQAAEDLERARQAAAALAPEPPPAIEEPSEAVRTAEALPAPEVGAKVWLRGVSVPGEALSVPGETGEFEVQLGALRTRVRLPQVERMETADGEIALPIATPPVPEAPEEVEVRGRRIEEGLVTVEGFIDDASRAGRERVRIIHGRGTGAMRQAIRGLLDDHPLVTKYEGGGPREGGEGVTIAYLAGAP
ncbi:MAG: endonuclease MutS2, partial [Chloroflexi bacterium]|nr:endonuclease MutS2 [Chloroflexota bacterium]